MSILCIGEMLIDFTPVSGMKNTYTANPGGAPANVAVSASRAGVKAGFLGKLGNDDFGRLLIDTLKKDNVEIMLPNLTDEAVTTLAFVSLDENGDRSFTFARKPGADMLLSTTDVENIDFTSWDIVHAGSVSQSGRPERDAVLLALEKAKKAGKIVSFDINFRDKIWSFDECKKEVLNVFPYVDLLKISEEELTLGGDGAVIFYAGEEITIPAMKAKCIDTTGAGDAYWGGFLSSLIKQGVRTVTDLDKDKLTAAGKYGAISGGLCIQKPGGIPALPTASEIETYL